MREQLLPDSKIAPHTRRSIPILRGLAYLSAYGVKPAGASILRNNLCDLATIVTKAMDARGVSSARMTT